MSRSFLKLILSVFMVAAIATASFAQDEANMARPNTKAGSAAWIFEFGGLASLGMNGLSIAGTTAPAAGWKWYFSDDMALRALLGFSTTSKGDKDSVGGKHSSTGFGIAVGVEMHTHPVYSTSPYFGAQISFGQGSSSTTVKTIESKTSSSVFGVGVVAGFDWYFTRGIAVGGEYMLGFSAASSSTTEDSSTSSNPSETTIGISSASVHLIVHF